ncbi:MAG: carbamoyl-phosphate synthase large subunit, partial [Thermodesulfovibrionales bacterium]|nr:carbamoyl-phosphate synthase large subunit [Thermodesulfovibrionales bacterium]
TWIDPWFLNNIRQIVEMEEKIKKVSNTPSLTLPPRGGGLGVGGNSEFRILLKDAKEYGFSDRRIAKLSGKTEAEIRKLRNESGIKPVYKMVDTCAAEFAAYTPYMYSTYEKPFYRIQDAGYSIQDETNHASCIMHHASVESEINPTERKKVIILGSGPNRIGQGIEFDYCCVHAVFALKELGYETIMVNCNPETVSTDYDTADRLYFEPLTIEDVLNIIDIEKPEGVIVQFGGQTPLKLAVPLEKEGVKILGTSPDSIDRAEDRRRFKELLHKLNLKQADSGTAMSTDEAIAVAKEIAYPVMVRPSYVLGGRDMESVYDESSLIDYMKRAVKASPEHPVLIDKYLAGAIEVDVDAISDGNNVLIGGVMEHIEEAGIHSGDSACSLPPYSLSKSIVDEIKKQTKALAKELNVIGLMNVQFAVKKGGSRVKGQGSGDYEIYILEVNPRASRTIPYVSKATGVPLAKFAAKVMMGKTLKELGLTKEKEITYVAVKEAVFPFDKFPGVDTILGPEMKSTGEVMGIDEDFGIAYAKAQLSSGNRIPVSGKIVISVRDEDKDGICDIVKKLHAMGFKVIATRGTAEHLSNKGIEVEVINKVKEGRPHIVDLIKNKEVNFIINTVSDAQAQRDSFSIRHSALQYRVPYTTTVSGAKAVVNAIDMLRRKNISIKSIQEYHKS